MSRKDAAKTLCSNKVSCPGSGVRTRADLDAHRNTPTSAQYLNLISPLRGQGVCLELSSSISVHVRASADMSGAGACIRTCRRVRHVYTHDRSEASFTG